MALHHVNMVTAELRHLSQFTPDEHPGHCGTCFKKLIIAIRMSAAHSLNKKSGACHLKEKRYCRDAPENRNHKTAL
jgi:hypothetical protein